MSRKHAYCKKLRKNLGWSDNAKQRKKGDGLKFIENNMEWPKPCLNGKCVAIKHCLMTEDFPIWTPSELWSCALDHIDSVWKNKNIWWNMVYCFVHNFKNYMSDTIWLINLASTWLCFVAKYFAFGQGLSIQLKCYCGLQSCSQRLWNK